LSLSACVSLVKKLYLLFQQSNIPVIRMGLQATADFENNSILLAGPFHPAFGHMVVAEIYRDRVIELIKSSGKGLESITLCVNPKRISTMRGMKNENIHYLKNQFDIRRINVSGDPLMPDHHISLVAGSEEDKIVV